MEEFTLETQPRKEFGSRAARRMRAAGRLPANIYGHGEENLAVTLETRAFRRFFDAGHRVVTLKMDGREEHGVVKEVQYDAFGIEPLHVDFSRVRRDETISMEVPVVTVGTPRGVTAGGVLESPLHELTIEGPANKMPESYELRIEELQVGESVRVRDLTPPPDCRILDDEEQVVVAIAAPREEVEPEAPEEAAAAEPEVISRKKEEEEEGKEGESS